MFWVKMRWCPRARMVSACWAFSAVDSPEPRASRRTPVKKVFSASSLARSITAVTPTSRPSRQAISTYDGSGRKPRNTE